MIHLRTELRRIWTAVEAPIRTDPTAEVYLHPCKARAAYAYRLQIPIRNLTTDSAGGTCFILVSDLLWRRLVLTTFGHVAALSR